MKGKAVVREASTGDRRHGRTAGAGEAQRAFDTKKEAVGTTGAEEETAAAATREEEEPDWSPDETAPPAEE